jgi:amidase
LGAKDKHKLDLIIVPSSLGIANDLAAKMGVPVMGVLLGFSPKGTDIQQDEDNTDLIRVALDIP